MVRQSVIRITDRKRRCAIFAVSEPKASPDLRPKTTEPIEKTNLFVKPSAIEFTRIAEAGKRKTKFNDTMKRIWMTTFLSLTLCAGPCGGRARANDNPPQEKTANPKVYLTRTITPEALVRIYEALGREATGRVAVKLSTGEPGGHHFLQPALVAPLVRKVGGTIVECNTAYGGGRAPAPSRPPAERPPSTASPPSRRWTSWTPRARRRIPVEGGRAPRRRTYVGAHLAELRFRRVAAVALQGPRDGRLRRGAQEHAPSASRRRRARCCIHTRRQDVQRTSRCGATLPPQDDFLESMAEAAKAVAGPPAGSGCCYVNVMNRLSVDCDCDSHPAAARNGRHRHPRLDRPRGAGQAPASTWSTHRTIPAKST